MLIFLQKSKIQTVGKRKKKLVILFQKFLVFPIWAFSENAQSFVGAFL